jgi:hypothetical protein
MPSADKVRLSEGTNYRPDEMSHTMPLVRQIVSKSTRKVLFVTNRMHSFETNVPFQRVSTEIDNLRVLLKTLNPNEIKNFRIIQGSIGP